MRSHVLNPNKTACYFAEQSAKFGVWATEKLQINFWYLEPGQEVITHKHLDCDDVLVLLEGEGHYYLFPPEMQDLPSQYQPEPQVKVVPPPRPEGLPEVPAVAMHPGMVAVAPAGTFHGFRNSQKGRAVLVAITAPGRPRSIYTVR